MLDLEILSNVDPLNAWPPNKKKFWERLQILSKRIIDKNVDITSDLNSDYFIIKMTYAPFHEAKEANALYHQICQLAPSYNPDRCENEFQQAIKKSQFKTIRKLEEICRFHGIDTTYEDEPTPEEGKAADYLPEGVNEEFFDEYGFFEKSHQYFTLESIGGGKWKPVPFTNFALKVLYHMNNGLQPRRMIEITNTRGRMKKVDIPTDKLVSKNEFKKFCEGQGNYRFFGSDGKLDMLKAYLYEQEREANEISVLGWHEHGFWCWSNGLFNSKFHPLDKNGFVELQDKNYYVPSGNHDQPNRNRTFGPQIRFRHFEDHTVSFTEWSLLYNTVFPQNGAIILTFAVACLFSDIVFDRKQFFPLLFVYGEGGSGKGSAIKMAQRLFGVPQDPLTLSGRANTDKAKIAIFAQFVNTMLLLEEYTPNHDTDQLLKNLWDRYGYKRRTMDMGYGTETVPIQSGVAITSNFTPSDDPLLQRIIYLDHNVNQFSEAQKAKFNELTVYSERGITTATHELLAKREFINIEFRDTQSALYKEVKNKYSGLSSCTDRMIENITILIAIHDILSRHQVSFPFTRDHLMDELVNTTISQNEKRDSGGEVQKFFDIFLSAVQKGELLEDVHYKLEHNNLFFNVKQVYGVYAQYHRSFYNTAGLTLGNLRDKLKIHPAYSGYSDTTRIGESRTSSYIFHYDQCAVDLISATSVYRGARASRNRVSETYEEKVSGMKQWEPLNGDLPM